MEIRRLRLHYLFAILFVYVMCTLGTYNFMADVGTYAGYALDIKLVELDAEKGTWTANGYIKWTENFIEEYNAVKAAKEEFIENNDVAKWIFHCGYSTTGKILRAVTIVAMAISMIFCAIMTVYVAYVTISKIVFKLKKRYMMRHEVVVDA